MEQFSNKNSPVARVELHDLRSQAAPQLSSSESWSIRPELRMKHVNPDQRLISDVVKMSESVELLHVQQCQYSVYHTATIFHQFWLCARQ